MKIDNKLNLVVTVGDTHFHSMPITKETFERYFKVIGKTFNEIYSDGYSFVAGVRIASLMLKETAKDMGILDDVQKGLINEIRRLTNVICLTDEGWKPLPVEVALKSGKIDQEMLDEVENQIVFFILISAMHKKDQVMEFLKPMIDLWGGELTSSNATAWSDSLSTSTTTEPTTHAEALLILR